ncbi:transcriptional regulator [Novosphingobium sp. BL-8A]|uniref:transcriptional regulator n=1 Tax=Novosphingobium sp. BL-8A TaxID=3127639 RepID=UPI003757F32B
MSLEHESDSPLARAVRKVGSQSAFGRLLGRRQSTIYGWLKNETPIPAKHVLVVEAATGISRHELAPDIYPIELQMPVPMSGGSPAVASSTPAAAAGVQDPLHGLQS